MLGLEKRARWWLAAAFSVALVGGCFKDAGGSGDGSGGCSEGAMGCACYGNGTCDGGLECREGSCVPIGCTEGSEDCVCVEGQCLGELTCADGLCKQPGDGTGDSTDTGTTDTGTTDTGTTDTGTTDTSTTDPTTMGSSSVSTDTTDTMGQTCDEQGDCRACVDCEGEKACQDEYAQCKNADACIAYVDCVLACGGDGNCWSECKGVAPDTYQLGDAWMLCTCEPCVQSCAGITDVVCK